MDLISVTLDARAALAGVHAASKALPSSAVLVAHCLFCTTLADDFRGQYILHYWLAFVAGFGGGLSTSLALMVRADLRAARRAARSPRGDALDHRASRRAAPPRADRAPLLAGGEGEGASSGARPPDKPAHLRSAPTSRPSTSSPATSWASPGRCAGGLPGPGSTRALRAGSSTVLQQHAQPGALPGKLPTSAPAGSI
jgi:hypothetical protein